MPTTEVVIFAEKDGSAPLVDWLDTQPEKVQNKCMVRIERLEALGHELRRPEADTLRDGVHELRVKHLRVNYRMLYFFNDKTAVLSHGITKESDVPDNEIDRAIEQRRRFKSNPAKHTYRE